MIATPPQEALSISSALALPRSLLTHVVGILAMRGAGKSYLASVVMEELVGQGLFVGFVDPLGIAWGIRASADGEHEGLPVVILGGRRGDLPLDPAAGTIVAQFLLEQRVPYILDLSLFDTEDQQRAFLADFIEAFRPHENVLMHLIVDESDVFAPQVPQSAEARRSLAAMQQVARRFRFKGIGGTFISQRPAELHKGVMQFDILLALCTTTPHDIKALDEWIKRNATEAERSTFLASLSSLPVGTAWAWSPQWLHLFQQVQVRQRSTYDSSKTPEIDTAFTEPKHLADINLTALSTRMEALMAHTHRTDLTLPPHLNQHVPTERQRARANHPKAEQSTLFLNRDEEIQHLRADVAQARHDLAARDEHIAALQGQIDALKHLAASVNGTTIALPDLPAYLQHLHIVQATITVDQLTGVPKDRMQEPGAPSEVAPAESISGIAERKKPRTVNEVLELLPHSQGLTLRNLLNKVKHLTRNERALFAWLLSNDGSKMRPLDLADAVCINVRATRPDRTAALRRIPFVQHPTNSGTYFVATFAAYALKAFPGAPAATVEAVKHCLLNAAR